jgi:hypothetical protein
VQAVITHRYEVLHRFAGEQAAHSSAVEHHSLDGRISITLWGRTTASRSNWCNSLKTVPACRESGTAALREFP